MFIIKKNKKKGQRKRGKEGKREYTNRKSNLYCYEMYKLKLQQKRLHVLYMFVLQ